jgi:hypothetical protein
MDEIRLLLEQLEKKLDDIEQRLEDVEKQNKIPYDPFPVIGPGRTTFTYPDMCNVCGMSFTDAHGRPLTMGYVCNQPNCPTKFTC